jgi:hypothetical protein
VWTALELLGNSYAFDLRWSLKKRSGAGRECDNMSRITKLKISGDTLSSWLGATGKRINETKRKNSKETI